MQNEHWNLLNFSIHFVYEWREFNTFMLTHLNWKVRSFFSNFSWFISKLFFFWKVNPKNWEEQLALISFLLRHSTVVRFEEKERGIIVKIRCECQFAIMEMSVNLQWMLYGKSSYSNLKIPKKKKQKLPQAFWAFFA